MDPRRRWVVGLEEVAGCDAATRDVGGKAARLATLARHGVHVAPGFCITTATYRAFIDSAGLADVVSMELGRKPLSQMRWEEMWDAALRIRNAFLRAPVAADLYDAITGGLDALGLDVPVAVRSSAVDEDAQGRSFAGLHETVLGVRGATALVKATVRVWASLWSDAAILYRRELHLDIASSAMAVLVQAEVPGGPSGVMFAREPGAFDDDRQLIEAVPGACADLVDGLVDPDRFTLSRRTGRLVSTRTGICDTDGVERSPALLDLEDLRGLHHCMAEVEGILGWPPDVEWTGRGECLTVLQARPISIRAGEPTDDREQYLSLRLSAQRLVGLRRTIEEEIIPGIEGAAVRLSSEPLEELSDIDLAAALRERARELQVWRDRYDTDLIPFAHGVRYFGAYYNDAVQPQDPFEFVGLLRGQQMIAMQRNRALAALAAVLDAAPELRDVVASGATGGDDFAWQAFRRDVVTADGGASFLEQLDGFLREFMNAAFDGSRLDERPLDLVANVLQLSHPNRAGAHAVLESAVSTPSSPGAEAGRLEARLLDAVGSSRHSEALELLELARFAWRLRDDDNILLARIEAELLRAVEIGAGRLQRRGRWGHPASGEAVLEALVDQLEGKEGEPSPEVAGAQWAAVDRVGDRGWAVADTYGPGERARQLVGQPAAPGLATGRAHRVHGAADIADFRAGDVLVCDAIQPMMTHLVPLAAAIVERRGGMLIHGAIIAREMNIPCVNGIAGAIERIPEGETLTVDGYLGIVTLGVAGLDPS